MELSTGLQIDQLFAWPAGRAERLAKCGRLPHLLLPDEKTIRFDRAEVERHIRRVDVSRPAPQGESEMDQIDRMFKRADQRVCAVREERWRRNNGLLERYLWRLIAGLDKKYRRLIPQTFRGINSCTIDEAVRDIDYFIRGYTRETKTWGRGSWLAYGCSQEFRLRSGMLSLRYGSAGISSGALPNLLASVMYRIVIANYQGAVQTWRFFCNDREVQDFKAADRVLVGDPGTLQKVDEDGELKEIQFQDAKETIQAQLYASGARISLQALVSDDTQTLATIGERIGKSADATIAKKVFQIIMANANMNQDGNALFSSAHGNLDSNASALSQTNLGVAVKNFKKLTRLQAVSQQGDSKEPAGIYPKYLLVPPELDISARAIVRNVETDNSPGNLTVLSEERLSDSAYSGNSATAYYLFADPDDADTIEVATLKGMKTPIVNVFPDPRILGMFVRVAHAFGVTPLDFRSMHKSVGA